VVEGYRYPAVSPRCIKGDETAGIYRKIIRKIIAGKRRPAGLRLRMRNKPESKLL
jgi:hypothetical protein